MRSIFFGDLEVGKHVDPLVIAEIGINHGGSLEVAKSMVDAAKRAGIRMVKHQTHVVDSEMSDMARNTVPGNSDKSIYDIMEECALNEGEEIELKRYVESQDMIFLSAAFSRDAAIRLEKMGVVGYKIGSGEMNNFPLVKLIASFKKPMIISTGMNDLATIRRLVSILDAMDAHYALLHTTNVYPTRPELVRLGAMQEMMREFPGVPIGLSDHTINNNACIAAVALGACIVERHFTDNMCRSGPDIICSMDEKTARELICSTKEVYMMRGGEKKPIKEEMVTMNFAFSTCVAIEDIKKGEAFTEHNLWVKRPCVDNDVIKAEHFEHLLGKQASQNIRSGTHITPKMVKDLDLSKDMRN